MSNEKFNRSKVARELLSKGMTVEGVIKKMKEMGDTKNDGQPDFTVNRIFKNEFSDGKSKVKKTKEDKKVKEKKNVEKKKESNDASKKEDNKVEEKKDVKKDKEEDFDVDLDEF